MYILSTQFAKIIILYCVGCIVTSILSLLPLSSALFTHVLTTFSNYCHNAFSSPFSNTAFLFVTLLIHYVVTALY
jgi:hypothetical protein